MSKYTNNDVEVSTLNTGERLDYEFALMKYNVDENQEIYQSQQTAKSIFNAQKFGDLFKDPSMFRETVYRLLYAILFIVIITFLIIWLLMILFNGQGEDNPRLKLMKNYLIYFVVLIVILIVFYYMYGKLFKETLETATLARE